MMDVFSGVSSFITDEEWSTVPFERSPKAPFHTALDIFAGLTPMGRLANFSESTTATEPFPKEAWETFSKEWKKLDDQFVRWLIDVTERLGSLFYPFYEDKSESGSPSKSGSSTDGSSTDGSSPDEFQEVYGYRVLEDAAAMLTYWTGRLMLLHHMQQVAQSPHAELGAMASQIIYNQKPALIDAADGILRTLPYCLRSSSGVVGMQTMALPLRSAMEYFASVGMLDRVARCHWFAEKLAAKEVNLGRSEIRLA